MKRIVCTYVRGRDFDGHRPGPSSMCRDNESTDLRFVVSFRSRSRPGLVLVRGSLGLSLEQRSRTPKLH